MVYLKTPIYQSIKEKKIQRDSQYLGRLNWVVWMHTLIYEIEQWTHYTLKRMHKSRTILFNNKNFRLMVCKDVY